MLSNRDLLAKTLQAEAGNQGLGGMMAVGSVIMNRVGPGQSISDIILAPGQFSAWNSVTGYAGGEQGQDMGAIKPSEDAYAAAGAAKKKQVNAVAGQRIIITQTFRSLSGVQVLVVIGQRSERICLVKRMPLKEESRLWTDSEQCLCRHSLQHRKCSKCNVNQEA